MGVENSYHFGLEVAVSSEMVESEPISLLISDRKSHKCFRVNEDKHVIEKYSPGTVLHDNIIIFWIFHEFSNEKDDYIFPLIWKLMTLNEA